uniref:GDDM n=1 Tax=Homo sapiens TaxID=9606 RepID=Q86XP7_HUMAN|nr:GDDM [Homo sapiens]
MGLEKKWARIHRTLCDKYRGPRTGAGRLLQSCSKG